MRCNEIQERLVELLYNESGNDPATKELQDHIFSCPTCQKELEELKGIRQTLRLWKDEIPLRAVAAPTRGDALRSRQFIVRRYLRYAATAALVVISLLALANAHIAWNKEGFSFSAHLFAWSEPRQDYYTKAEVRNLLKSALDDTENRMTETSYLMMQRMLDTVDQDRWMDLHLVRDQSALTRNKY